MGRWLRGLAERSQMSGPLTYDEVLPPLVPPVLRMVKEFADVAVSIPLVMVSVLATVMGWLNDTPPLVLLMNK